MLTAAEKPILLKFSACLHCSHVLKSSWQFNTFRHAIRSLQVTTLGADFNIKATAMHDVRYLELRILNIPIILALPKINHVFNAHLYCLSVRSTFTKAILFFCGIEIN